MKGQQREMRRPISAMGAEGPADRSGNRLQPFAMLAEPSRVGFPDILDATNDEVAALLYPFETDAPIERQIFLGGIDDLQQMPADPGSRKTRNRLVYRLDVGEKIADQHELPGARQRMTVVM